MKLIFVFRISFSVEGHFSGYRCGTFLHCFKDLLLSLMVLLMISVFPVFLLKAAAPGLVSVMAGMGSPISSSTVDLSEVSMDIFRCGVAFVDVCHLKALDPHAFSVLFF